MERRILGRTGLAVSALGFGGSEIGYGEVGGDQVTELLNAALDAGLNVIDTAECYRESETKIGEAIAHRRGEFHLFTKCGHSGADLGGEDWDPAVLARSIDRSLERLGVDHLDLVQLHSCSLELLQKGEVIEAVERARDAGKTRFIGYSGDNEAAAFAVASGRFDALQTSFSVADQANLATIAAAHTAGIGVIVKRPVANAAWTYEPKPDAYQRGYHDRLKVLDYAGLDMALALRFTLSTPGVTTAIVGTTKPGRWTENAALLTGGPLLADEWNAIRERWSTIAEPDWTGLT